MRRFSTHIHISLQFAILIIFSIPFLNIFPCGNRFDPFIHAENIYKNGPLSYLQLSMMYPLLLLLFNMRFTIFGLTVYSFNLVGLILGIFGIMGISLLAKKMFLINEVTPILAAFLLATFPIFIANGVIPTDYYFITVLIILSFLFYAKKNFVLYIITASIAGLAKDSALILPLSILLIEIWYNIKNKTNNLARIITWIIFLIPFFVYFWRLSVLHIEAATIWKEIIYTETRHNEIFSNVLYNVLNFNFYNDFVVNHLITLFYINFNWIYWLIAGFGVFFFLQKKSFKTIKAMLFNSELSKVKLSILLFCFIYIFFTSIAQTDPFPAQYLPIIPYVLIVDAVILSSINSKNYLVKIVVFFVIIIFTYLHLFYSKDPISNIIWNRKNVAHQNIYYHNEIDKGNNMFVYNLQYFYIIRNKNESNCNQKFL